MAIERKKNMDACLQKLRRNKSIEIRARTISMAFGYHGEPLTQLHGGYQLELQPASILMYCRPFMKLCAYLAGRGTPWALDFDLISPLSKAKVDETALKRNLSQLINNESAVRSLRELTADFAADVASVLEATPEVILLVDLTTLFLSVLDGDAKITAIIRDNLICEAAALHAATKL